MDVVLHESRFLTISAVVRELLSLGRSPRMAKWLAEWTSAGANNEFL
jgi:hypothetical protein